MATAQQPKNAGFDIALFMQAELAEHRQVFEATAAALGQSLAAALELLQASIASGGKLLLFGNGGSAADAQHMAAECVIRYKSNRPAIAAIALTTDTSALTACANDFGFDTVFARQIEALARPADVAIGFSTSGHSPNVLAGLAEARRQRLGTIGFTGGTGGKMGDLCDVMINVPSNVTARIQEMHILIGHMLCKSLEQRLGLV
jgi:D-sedoheptulose 7-phosphate isomerase